MALVLSGPALGEVAQALDYRSKASADAGPVDRVERVLYQQSEFGIAVDREAAGEEQRIRILQAACEAVVIPGAGADRDFGRAAKRRQEPEQGIPGIPGQSNISQFLQTGRRAAKGDLR